MLLPGVLAVALLAAACSSDPGPLGASSPVNAADCAENAIGTQIAAGLWRLGDAVIHQEVTVNSVRLTDNHGLALGGAWLAPVADNILIGMGAYWPLSVKQFPAWRYRERADGAVVKPGQWPNLVIRVWRTGTKAGEASITVWYTSGGSSYTWTGSEQVAIAANCNNVPI
jgi:hypothetical protein